MFFAVSWNVFVQMNAPLLDYARTIIVQTSYIIIIWPVVLQTLESRLCIHVGQIAILHPGNCDKLIYLHNYIT